jgi:hypothetical protein
MNLKQVTRGTFALFVTALVVLAIGAYTDNGGFQLAGALFLLVALVVAINEARDRDGSG